MNARHAAVLLILGGCSLFNPDHLDRHRTARNVTSADGATGPVVDGHNAFSWDLYRELSAENPDENLFFSPFSVTSGLSMAMAGANGTTESEMHDVLHVTGDEGDWHTALGALTRDLDGDYQRGYTLNLANRVFGQSDYAWDGAFLAVCDGDYGAPFDAWDFATDPEGGRDHVNGWVSDQTDGRITELLPAGSVDMNTRMVLADAITFLGDWATAFDPADTHAADFTRLDGSAVSVQMMRMSLDDLKKEYVEVGIVDHDTAAIVRMPYQDDEVSMLLVVPLAPDGLANVEADLDAGAWASWLARVGPSDATIGMPKFDMTYDNDLTDALSALGMPTAFTDDADFTGMTTTEPLKVTHVEHQAYVKIDEQGTEARAATGITIGTKYAIGDPILADHPFLFVIQDDLTGAILFMGRVTDPS